MMTVLVPGLPNSGYVCVYNFSGDGTSSSVLMVGSFVQSQYISDFTMCPKSTVDASVIVTILLLQSTFAFCTVKFASGIEPFTVNVCDIVSAQPLFDVMTSVAV